jgi:hypothetical protein
MRTKQNCTYAISDDKLNLGDTLQFALSILQKTAAVTSDFPPRRSGFELGQDHVGFVVDKVTLGQVFSSTSIPLPNFIPPAAPQSPSSIVWSRYNRPVLVAVPSGLTKINKK